VPRPKKTLKARVVARENFPYLSSSPQIKFFLEDAREETLNLKRKKVCLAARTTPTPFRELSAYPPPEVADEEDILRPRKGNEAEEGEGDEGVAKEDVIDWRRSNAMLVLGAASGTIAIMTLLLSVSEKGGTISSRLIGRTEE